jgi:Zn-dependent M16 (insulinase) family peptidase
MATRIALATGGIGSSLVCKSQIRRDELFFHTFIHGKSLLPRFGEMLDIIKDLLLSPDLKNKKQIKDILLEERNGLHASVVSSGHQFAITRASSYLSSSRYIDEQMGGIAQLRFLDDLAKGDKINQIVESILQLHKIVINKKACVISVTSDNPNDIETQLKSFLNQLPEGDIVRVSYLPSGPVPKKPIGIEISAAVNFVARTWKMPPARPETSGLLYLMSRHLSTGYLWDKVRVEGGAYGGMAIMSLSQPIFACASYRDPNLASTLIHFEQGLKEVASCIAQDKIDQSIIGTIGKIDAPQPPHALGFGETMDRLVGYTGEFKQALREVILNAESEKLKRTAIEVIETKEDVITILGGGAAFDAAQAQGIVFDREELIKS